MSIASSRQVFRVKLFFTGLAASFAIFGFLGFSPKIDLVRASSSGPTSSHTNAPSESNCTACHTDFPLNGGAGSMIIAGVPTNYLPNQQVPVTVTINDSNAVIFGFQMTAIDSQGKKVGTFSFPAQNPQPLKIVQGLVGGNQRDYIEHTSSGISPLPMQFGTKSWTFKWTAPNTRAGKVRFYAAGNAANSDGDTSGDYIYATNKATLSGSAIANFDNDIKSDISVWRPSTGIWYSLNSGNGNFQAFQFGSNGDKVVSADYDGDGKSDFAVWRPSNGVWYVQKSSGGISFTQFGANGDIPVIGDFDGDLKADFAVWRPSNGVWYILKSSDGRLDIRQFGISTDKIAQGDYDGDGKTDIAVFRSSNGVWYIWKSSDNSFAFTSFGTNGDKPVQGDYDGDGKTDIAVFRPSDRVWYFLKSRDGFSATQFGLSTDKPAPADFDGDGKSDICVFRDGIWYFLRSSDNSFASVSFGTNGDIPVPRGYLAE